MSTVRWLVDLHRRHPGRLLLASSAVFLPLMPVRLLAVDARAFAAAIALSVAGHLALAAILHARREQLGLRPFTGGVTALVIGLPLLTMVEIVAGRGFEAVVGTSSIAVTLGGTLPSILVGPAWAGLVAGLVATRTTSRRAT